MTEDAPRSLSERLVIAHHRYKRFLTKIVTAICIALAVASCVVTYFLISSLSPKTITEVIIVQVLLTLLSMLATFAWTPRFLITMSIFAGIGFGASLRIIWP